MASSFAVFTAIGSQATWATRGFFLGAQVIRTDDDTVEAIVAVKRGFSWPALLSPALWSLWKGMWAVFFGYVAAFVVLDSVATVLINRLDVVTVMHIMAVIGMNVVFRVYVASKANGWLRAKLGALGMAETAETRATCTDDAIMNLRFPKSALAHGFLRFSPNRDRMA